jgi:hypothetical protein
MKTVVYMELIICKGRGKDKSNVHPITFHEGTKVERKYSYTLSLTSGLDESGWSTKNRGHFTLGKLFGTLSIGG